jgi:hypothetical protein
VKGREADTRPMPAPAPVMMTTWSLKETGGIEGGKRGGEAVSGG